MGLSKAEKRKLCSGCRESFYNGNNDFNIKECWNLSSARLAHKRFVPAWMEPPWDGIPVERTLSCHRREGYAAMEEGKK